MERKPLGGFFEGEGNVRGCFYWEKYLKGANEDPLAETQFIWKLGHQVGTGSLFVHANTYFEIIIESISSQATGITAVWKL